MLQWSATERQVVFMVEISKIKRGFLQTNRRFLLSLTALSLLLSPVFSVVSPHIATAAAPDPFPSTNATNLSLGNPYVEEVSKTPTSVTLRFVNPKSFTVWFERRIDNAPSTLTAKYGPCRVGNPSLPSACAGKRYLEEDDLSYPSVSVPANTSTLRTFTATSNVAVRSTFGPERSWDFDWTTFNVLTPPVASASNFISSPRYVRANSAVDSSAAVRVPGSADSVRFNFVSASTTISNIAGYEHIQSGQWPNSAGDKQFRVITPLPGGEYTITAEFSIGGSWYPVTGSAIAYSIDTPTASYTTPSASRHIFRPSDNPVRLRVEDQFNQFNRMVVTINGVQYEVLRNQCDLRQAGNYLFCDVKSSSTWSGLPEGTYTATTTTYTKANNRVDNLPSVPFTIDAVSPVVANLVVPATATDTLDVSVDATDANGIELVRFYLALPDTDGTCKNNLPSIRDAYGLLGTGNTYTATFVTDDLDGVYCVLASAKDAASHNSVPLFAATVISNPDDTGGSGGGTGGTGGTGGGSAGTGGAGGQAGGVQGTTGTAGLQVVVPAQVATLQAGAPQNQVLGTGNTDQPQTTGESGNVQTNDENRPKTDVKGAENDKGSVISSSWKYLLLVLVAFGGLWWLIARKKSQSDEE